MDEYRKNYRKIPSADGARCKTCQRYRGQNYMGTCSFPLDRGREVNVCIVGANSVCDDFKEATQ